MLFARMSSCYNPFCLCFNSSETLHSDEINRIYFYDHETGEILADTNWFGGGSNNDFKTLEICPGVEPKMKKKLDLFSPVPFIMRTRLDYKTNPLLNVYIPIAATKGWKHEKRVKRSQEWNKMDEHYNDIVTVTVTARRKRYEMTNDGWKWVTPEEATEQAVVFDCNHDFVRTAYGKRCDRLSERAKKARVDLSAYDIEKLLEVFNITEKRTK